MSAFFSNLLRFPPRPIKAVKSFWEEDTVLELERWIERDYSYAMVALSGGCSKRQVAKGVKALYSTKAHPPCNLKIQENTYFNKLSESEFLEIVLSNKGPTAVYVPTEQFEEAVTCCEKGADWKGLSVEVMHEWTIPYRTIKQHLEATLRETWYLVQRKKGNAPEACPECKDRSGIDADGDCLNEHCGAFIGQDLNIPDGSVEIYKDIIAYEKETGRSFLPYVTK